MNPQALKLNETLQRVAPQVYDMLSQLGKQIYFPKEGILNQSAEAGKLAKKYNATIGIATEYGKPMHLKVIQDTLSAYDPKDLYGYAPPAGKPELREAWKQKMLKENPSLSGKPISMPIVTNALTHGLSIVADLFADPGDAVIYPDMNWENYELTFKIRRGANLVHFPLYNEQGTFHAEALKEAILSQQTSGKAIVVLNFPNNPTGYTPSEAEGEAIVAAVRAGAEAGIKVVVVSDDAYYGLFFEGSMRQSLFAQLSNMHDNVLAIKVDGATKEEYVWGFRVGFITYSYGQQEVMDVLEQKTLGIIRATISSGPHPSQTFVLHALKSPDFAKQKQEKYEIMRGRAEAVKRVLDSGAFDDAWDYYPFNSGYFMCLKLKTVNAEALRVHLLKQYGIGTIALGDTDVRIAFSCIEEENIEDLFHTIYKGVKDIEQQA